MKIKDIGNFNLNIVVGLICVVLVVFAIGISQYIFGIWLGLIGLLSIIVGIIDIRNGG